MKVDEIRRLIINDLFLNMDDDDAEDTLERIDEYAAEVSRELQEPIENALYATGKFTTDECMELTEGIIQYVKEQEEQQ